MSKPTLVPDDETGAVYQATDRVLYVRAKDGWFAFGNSKVLPFDLDNVHEGQPMMKLLDARGVLTSYYQNSVAGKRSLFTR